MTEFTYPYAGATRTGVLPDHYHHLRHRVRIGHGPEVFARAGAALMTFGMHRAAGARVTTTGERAEPGLRLTVGLGPFTVPNEVVYTIEEPTRVGFAYGTLPGHQESGEEAFLLESRPDGVWLTVTAFSRPVRWPVILAGPLAMIAQRGFAWQCGRALARIGTVCP